MNLDKRVITIPFVLLLWSICVMLSFAPTLALATSIGTPVIATTTVRLSICGNALVDDGEDCDAPGETGSYSTTIVGRQCNSQCMWGPYCGDGILQTIYGEECDDGNNDNGDFCSATCTIEPAGSGGGGSSGGGSGSSGGSNRDLGDTQVSISGMAYPNTTVHILIDAAEVGTVRTNGDGKFDFANTAPPGTVSLGFWAYDSNNTRSITLNTTFDVTQGAITNVNGIMLPPTITADNVQVNPGDTINFSGQAAPNSKVELQFDDNTLTKTTSAGVNGKWTLVFDASELSTAEHTVRARYIVGDHLTTESNYSTTLQLFVGVDGSPTSSSDLNRDGSVNLTDFSILIFWWGTTGGDSNLPADISGNGNVGLEDFSIMLYNWTG